MKKTRFYFIVSLTLLWMVLNGCSAGKEPAEPAKGAEKAATQQATEAIKDYGRKPIDQARAAQRLGEERATAIDEAGRKP